MRSSEVTIEDIGRIAVIHFRDIVLKSKLINYKLRLFLIDNSYIDVNLSSKIPGKFGYHWETRNTESEIFRYDNFPDIKWKNVDTYPEHFHYRKQNKVVASPFPAEIEPGFKSFMQFVREMINKKAAE